MSNAWLGKDYGLQLKQFLLDNFQVRYVVKSEAEHWFQNAQVSTVYVVVQRGGAGTAPARFVTMRQPLSTFAGKSAADIVQHVADFYDQVDTCEQPANTDWAADPDYPTAYEHTAGHTRVSLVPTTRLRAMVATQENWENCFLAADLLADFTGYLVTPTGPIFTNGRGKKTPANKFFIITAAQQKTAKIEDRFLKPILKSSQEIKFLHHKAQTKTNFFVCSDDEDVLRQHYPNAYRWIKQGQNALNKDGIRLSELLKKNKPHWYTLKPTEPASIFISINPEKRAFFSYVDVPLRTDQRLVNIRPTVATDTTLVAALLNSIVTLLIVEIRGTARNLGALDLNSNFFKKYIQMLNPALLDAGKRRDILTAFLPLSQRLIQDYDTEFTQHDRLLFDQAVFTAFGLPISRVPKMYEQLTDLIQNRVTRKDK